MNTRTLISVEEYLTTVYRPDCDYVDGEVLERNLGERDHGRLQVKFGAYFLARQALWNSYVIVEQRVQVSRQRFRVPDVCVFSERRMSRSSPFHPSSASRFFPPKIA